MKIMIVDDSQTIRRLIRSVLQSEGTEIIECSDGQEAIDGYPVHRPDWVVMDLEMGQVDGFEATRQIKSKFPEARIVILTSFDDEFMKAASLASGACAYLLKDNIQEIPTLLRTGPGTSLPN